MTSPLVLLILVHPQGLSQQAARYQRDQHRQGDEGLDGVSIPRPGVSASAHLPLAAAKTARQTARPALALAGGAYFCAGPVAAMGSISRSPWVQLPRRTPIPQAPLATATRNSLGHSFARPHTSGCAGTQPGGRVIHLSTGTTQVGRLGGRRPVLTISLSSL